MGGGGDGTDHRPEGWPPTGVSWSPLRCSQGFSTPRHGGRLDQGDPTPDNYDTPWKAALTRYLPEFMAFYIPEAHAAIDWHQPPRFLD